MKEIYLRNIDASAIVDDDDYDWVSSYSWYGYKKPEDKKHYVRAMVFQGLDAMGKRIYHVLHLHRLIADAAKGQAVTFRNRNSLDCRRENLVIATAREITTHAERQPCNTGYYGVTLEQSGRYAARISVNYQSVGLGIYSTAERAALAYDAAARKYNGELATVNFPNVKDYSGLSETGAKGTPARKRRHASSKYLGVTFLKRSGRWLSVITRGREHTTLGCYDTEREAALAYDKRAREMRGEDATLNFPKVTDYSGIERKSGRVKGRRKTTSRYLGVCWDANWRKWKATITHKGNVIHVGVFDNEREAAEAFDRKALVLRGKTSILNFPKPLKPNEQDYEQRTAPYCWSE